MNRLLSQNKESRNISQYMWKFNTWQSVISTQGDNNELFNKRCYH